MRKMHREQRKVGIRRSNGARGCLRGIWRNSFPEASVCNGQRLEPVAVATPWFDWPDVVYELAWPRRRELDTHDGRSLLSAGACIEDCFQWGWPVLLQMKHFLSLPSSFGCLHSDAVWLFLLQLMHVMSLRSRGGGAPERAAGPVLGGPARGAYLC